MNLDRLSWGVLLAGRSLHPHRQHAGILLSRIEAVNIEFQRPPTLHDFSTLIESARVNRPPRRNQSMTSVRQANGVLFAITTLMMLLYTPPDGEAAGERTYRVHGQVIAVNVAKTPHMIVVKTPLTKHDNMTVGANVTAQSRIVRKGKRIALQTIGVGEGVWLTYVKQRDGVFAKIIQVQ